LFLERSTKTAAIRAALYAPTFVGWGFAPDPTGGAYSAPPDPLAVFRGLLLKGGEVRGEEEKGGEGGSSSFALGRKKRRVGSYARTSVTTIIRLFVSYS